MPKHRKPLSDEEIYARMHEDALDTDGVIELGSTTRSQGALFEKIRTGISHGHMLKTTFDEAVKRRSQINYEGTKMPRVVSSEIFDADVLKLENMTESEAQAFDDEVCFARMERRADGGGVYVSSDRASGFGPDVYGFAYDLCSGKWCMTNEFGAHSYCERHLRTDLEENDEVEIVCGFIFQLDSIQTPVMTPHGYIWNSPHLMKKGFEDLWSWKKFIPIDSVEVAPRKHLWKQLFTPDYAEKVVQASR